jgi:hypothetical protein
MAKQLIIHQHSVAPARRHEAFRWFAKDLAPGLFDHGFEAVRRYQLLDFQLQPENPQPFGYVSVLEFDPDQSPKALEAFSQLGRVWPLANGLFTEDSSHVYEVTRNWVPGPNESDLGAPEYAMLVMANYVVEMEDEYHDWYDRVHGPEVLGTPGYVGLRRGRIAPVQAVPNNDYPSNAVMLATIRSKSIIESLDEFKARANDESKTGIHWNLRSPSASLARTTHMLTPMTPNLIA